MVEFKVFPVSSKLPESYQLASKEHVEANHKAVMSAMPEFEAAELTNGWVDGSKYGSKIGTKRRTDLVKKLGIKRDSTLVVTNIIPESSNIHHSSTTEGSTSHSSIPEKLQELLDKARPSNGGGITVNYYTGPIFILGSNDSEQQKKQQPCRTYSAPGGSQVRITFPESD